MIKFNKCKLDSKLLDQWVTTDVNVLLIGEKGVGKSHQIIDAFKRNKLKYAYFSGATLDPWIHLLGIPKARLQEDGTEKMEFILPENLDNDVEAIFCDEWNRTNKVVRNALLELQQFKSINGRKFPKLRMVWGAVNPPATNEEDASYDVDELDPAQLDRFHIVVELPNEPDLKYFKSKFGDFHGKILVDWWGDQPKEAYKILSPRRLEYLGECFNKGLDIKYLLPESANAKDLIKKLSVDEKTELINRLFNSPTDDTMKAFVEIDENFLKYKNRLLDDKYWDYWKYANPEFISEEIDRNQAFADYAIFQVMSKREPVYNNTLIDISKKDPDNTNVKVLKNLLEQKYTVPVADPNSIVDFAIVETGNTPDTFGKWNHFSTKTLPRKFTPQDNIYYMTTQERRKGLELLNNTFDDAGVNNPYHVINFVISCLMSMQKGTLANDKNFMPIFGSVCKLAKKTLSSKDMKQFISQITYNKSKISSNRYEDYIKYLGGIEYSGRLPKAFVDKVTEIRGVLGISSGKADILQLLNL